MVNYGIHGKENMFVPLLLQYAEASIIMKTNPLSLYIVSSLSIKDFDIYAEILWKTMWFQIQV